MYAGTTFHGKSGGFIGVHQRIDRLARRDLARITGNTLGFPSIHEILHFEGNNGPDGIKRKSPSVDEPWHYIDPTNPSDTQLLTMLAEHKHNLVAALKAGDRVRASFEAAWMAHAITDGLTPAHHYPLSDKIEELWGKPKEERLSVIDKNFIRGSGSRDTVRKNWKYWGAKGVFVTHILFELGVASSIKTTRFNDITPSEERLKAAESKGLQQVFTEAMHEIVALDMYHTYWQQGWTHTLAQQTRTELMPKIINVVTYAWYEALQEASV